ncbi:hypothetical protein HMPREF9103_00603 [Lentilactobacillus parafarraginis F0439]|uniref:Uncharacterized protein n=1 Tax=Lentilactobacillus parafarraginis F0439 TaxID=797515 RepID=G9ZLJ6_9LACO|nr:hypothetical protein HMPREF9103_00603 [Lentilactobacillus parafarraginis F0439]
MVCVVNSSFNFEKLFLKVMDKMKVLFMTFSMGMDIHDRFHELSAVIQAVSS